MLSTSPSSIGNRTDWLGVESFGSPVSWHHDDLNLPEDLGLPLLNQGSSSSAPADFLGDRFDTAYNSGNLTGNFNVNRSGSVTPTNDSDYVRFSVSNLTSFNLSLTGLSADADVALLKLTNAGVEWVDFSNNPGALAESITQQLTAGTYAIEVVSYGGATTDYQLSFSTAGADIDAGNTLNTALDIGEISRYDYNRGGNLSQFDPNDSFRFELRESTTVDLSLTINAFSNPFLNNINVTLRDIGGGFIAQSINPGTASESIRQVLNAGIYYIELNAVVSSLRTSASVSYTLALEGAQYVNANPNFNATYGYGLVNAAEAVAASLAYLPFTDVSDLGGNSWGEDLVKAPEAWARGFTGQGITVAVIDSGVDINHPDLKNNIWVNVREIPNNGFDDDRNGYTDDVYGWNFGVGQNNNNVLPGNLYNDHGTHVAGTIAAAKNNFGVTGVAPDAKIMAIRLGDVDEYGSFTNGGSLATAIRYAVDNGARVINLSLGSDNTAELRDALAYAAGKKVIVVSAAGNDAISSPSTPASYAIDHGIAVGAVDIQREIADFSNLASADSRMQYVVAPGVKIYSTLPGGRYGFQNGTSMAAPHVAGVVALMLSANPNLNDAQVRQVLTSTATRLT